MELSESGKMYLQNYYALELTRNELHYYLESMAIDFGKKVEEFCIAEHNPNFSFEKFVQKGGGHVEFSLKHKATVGNQKENLDKENKFYILYEDAIRSETLASPTVYRIRGFTPKILKGFANEIQMAAKDLGIENPYVESTYDLCGSTYDDAILNIADSFIERIQQFTEIYDYILSKKNQ